MKTTRLRKRSKSKATLDRADRALQDWYRKTYEFTPCEVCSSAFQVMHHHNEKSKSNAGRYLHDNLIFLCNACHSKITFGDHNVVATYSIQRGKEWIERMKKLKKEPKPYYSKKELEKIIENYKL